MKKQLLFFLMLLLVTLLPDELLWCRFTEDPNLLIRAVWFFPSALIIGAWVCKVRGYHPSLAIKVLACGLLCVALPKVVFVLTFWLLDCWTAFYLSALAFAGALCALVARWKHLDNLFG
jgi:hypothetical protein